MGRRWISIGVLAAMLATVLPTAAFAGSTGRRNTALGLSGLAAYELLRGHTTVGALSAAGAAYAWLQYSKARKAEKRRRQLAQYYRSRYYGSPYYRVRGYRSSYGYRRSYARRTAYRGSSRRRTYRTASSPYSAGYRAGYRQGAYSAGFQAGYHHGLQAPGA